MDSRKVCQASVIQGWLPWTFLPVLFPFCPFTFYSFQCLTLEVRDRGRKNWTGHLSGFLADLDTDTTKQKKKLGWRQGWSWCLKSACSLDLQFSLDLRIHVNISGTEWMVPKFLLLGGLHW